MPNDVVMVEPAATLVLLQDSEDGPRVLMQQRNPNAGFVGGAWVFPGGKLDPEDYDEQWLQQVDITQDRANRLLGTDQQALGYWIAALRETLEEAGLLLALQDGAPVPAALAAIAQQTLQQPGTTFLEFCQQHALALPANSLRYLSRWVTPEGLPRRYDTRFFMAAAPANQIPVQDDHEVVATCWVTPAEALQHYNRNDWAMVMPTIVTLRQLQGYDNVDSLLKRLGNHIDPKSE